jgi:transcription termination factor NusB
MAEKKKAKTEEKTETKTKAENCFKSITDTVCKEFNRIDDECGHALSKGIKTFEEMTNSIDNAFNELINKRKE